MCRRKLMLAAGSLLGDGGCPEQSWDQHAVSLCLALLVWWERFMFFSLRLHQRFTNVVWDIKNLKSGGFIANWLCPRHWTNFKKNHANVKGRYKFRIKRVGVRVCLKNLAIFTLNVAVCVNVLWRLHVFCRCCVHVEKVVSSLPETGRLSWAVGRGKYMWGHISRVTWDHLPNSALFSLLWLFSLYPTVPWVGQPASRVSSWDTVHFLTII